MINSVTVINYRGESMTFDLAFPEKSGFAISSIEGTGPVKANINTVDMVTVDGSQYNSAHIGQRNIVFTFIPNGTLGAKEYTGEAGVHYETGEYCYYKGAMLRCISGHTAVKGPPNLGKWRLASQHAVMEESRHLLYKYFPVKKNLTLKFTTETRNECSIEGYVESNEPSPFSKQEEIKISVICPSPFFYSSGMGGDMSSDMTMSGFHFPYPDKEDEMQEEDEFYFEQFQIGSEFVINYAGDVESGLYIDIDIKDELSGTIEIENRSTGERFKVSSNFHVFDSASGTGLGESFLTGDKLFISTFKGEKRVELTRNHQTYNIYNNFSEDSDWIYLVKGNNRMVVNLLSNGGQGTVTAEVSVTFNYKLLFEGL